MSLASPIDAGMQPVVWTRTLEESVPALPALAGEASADLVVVGGGYCGLATAIHAARAGLSVIVLEAGIVGNGASGRNGGFTVPHFPKGVTPSDVEAHLGKRKGAALAELVVGGAEAVFRQIREHQIRCGAVQNGWIQPAHSAHSLAAVRRVYEEWRALGADVAWLDGGEIRERTGARGYFGGWTNPTGGTVNSYGLVLGLARVAQGLGVRLHERSRAVRYEAAPGGWVVTANGRPVRARQVVVAVNGYADATLPAVLRSTVPVHLFHVATKPLSPRLRERILATRLCFTDLRKSGGFSRLDPAGRLIAGGAVLELGDRRAYGIAHARRRILGYYPELAGEPIEIETYWSGYCAVTDSFLPHVQVLGDGFLSVGGFSTRGVALGQNIGRVMGELAAGRRTLDDVPLEVRDVRRDVPFWPLKTRLARYMFPVLQARDRLGLS